MWAPAPGPLHNSVIPARAGIQVLSRCRGQLADAGISPSPQPSPVKGEGVTQGQSHYDQHQLWTACGPHSARGRVSNPPLRAPYVSNRPYGRPMFQSRSRQNAIALGLAAGQSHCDQHQLWTACGPHSARGRVSNPPLRAPYVSNRPLRAPCVSEPVKAKCNRPAGVMGVPARTVTVVASIFIKLCYHTGL